MIRVLVVHNRYRSAMPSGENRVVDDEVQLLRAHGLDVESYQRSSDEIAGFGPREKIALTVRPIYSLEDARAFRAAIARFRPDVVHLHNPFPLISPWVVRVAHQAGIPVVQTVHNYRYSCPSGTLFRDGQVCNECHGRKTPWPSVVHGCYRGSRAQSAVMAATARVHRPTRDTIDQFLPVSHFVAMKLVESGVSPDRITVKPNFVTDPGPVQPRGDGFLFAGRLEEAKGVRLLLDAWTRAGIGARSRLVIAGDGPDRDLVASAATTLRGVSFLGRVDAPRVGELLDEAAVLVMPSIWYEGLPRIVVEAFARGRPVLATAIGSLGEAVDDGVGWSSEPTVGSLAAALRSSANRAGADGRAAGARRRYEDRYRPAAVLEVLEAVYEQVTTSNRASIVAAP